ncbi:MAG: hypothetical protein JJ979_25120, partial [Roseibium sp.]|nr:hypothetical protein [Roseibium sp.]
RMGRARPGPPLTAFKTRSLRATMAEIPGTLKALTEFSRHQSGNRS